MSSEIRLRVAIQKSGRLAEKSLTLLSKCGLDFDLRKDRLLHECRDFPIDLMLVRDDDIPEYVADGVCQLGIVGENVLEEKILKDAAKNSESIEVLKKLKYGQCRLSLAVPEEMNFFSPSELQGKKIATSYPNILKDYLRSQGVEAKIVELSGSVEIAPGLKIADAICDLVSTGGTLRSNGLKEVGVILKSQAVIIKTAQPLDLFAENNILRLMQRVNGVLEASESKYIMMNAPKNALNKICEIIPGMEEPSVIPLGVDGEKIAIHAVAREAFFWETIEKLKAVGASSILVLPIEKVVE